MWRWSGCTQPPPPLRMRHRCAEPFLTDASGLVGSNASPLISHSYSGDRFELPRCSSNVGTLLSLTCEIASGMSCGGSSRSLAGGALPSRAAAPRPSFLSGALLGGAFEAHTRPGVLFIVLTREKSPPL